MTEKEEKKKINPKDLFKSLFKDLGFYLLVLVVGILLYSSVKVYKVYGFVFGSGEFWIILAITAILLIALIIITFIYTPTSNVLLIPIASLFFGVVFDAPILFKVSLFTAIIYPIWILTSNYIEFKKAQDKINEKYKSKK